MSEMTDKTQPEPRSKPVIVPMGITIGLGVFALILALAGYGFRLLAGDEFAVVARHALVVVSFFMVVVPSAFVGGSKIVNKIKGSNIHWRNACTLGFLMSCVMILTIMGRYS